MQEERDISRLNSKWSEPFNSSLTNQYFRIEPTIFEDRVIDHVQFVYEIQKFKNCADIIYEYLKLTGLNEYLKICLFVQRSDLDETWFLLNESNIIDAWIRMFNLQHAQVIKLKVTISKIESSIIDEEASVPLYDIKYFKYLNKIPIEIGFLTEDKELVFKEFKGDEPLSTFLPRLIRNQHFGNYKFYVMSFLKEVEIQPHFTINHFNQRTGQRYLDRGSVVRICREGERQRLNIPNVRIKGSEVSIQINYEVYKHFRCQNIVKMANIIMPSTYALLYKESLITSKNPLNDLRLENIEDPIQILLLDAAGIYNWLLHTETTYKDYIEDQTLKQVDQLLALSETHLSDLQTKIQSLMNTLNTTRDSESSRYLPKIIYDCKFFKSITANTSIHYHRTVNFHHRTKNFIQLSSNQKTSKVRRYSLILSRNLQILPYEMMEKDNNLEVLAYRGQKNTYLVQINDIVESYSFLSSSKKEQKAREFTRDRDRNITKPYTIFQFNHYSGRYIEPFTATSSEHEVLFACHTKFIVKQKMKINSLENRIKLEELPSIRNIGNSHIIWIDKHVDKGIKLVNQWRKKRRQPEDYFYLMTDILPFKSNAILQIWLEHFSYWPIPRERTVVVFSLSEDETQNKERIRFIRNHFAAALYICFGNIQLNIVNFKRIAIRLNPLVFCSTTQQISTQLFSNRNVNEAHCKFCQLI